MRGYNKGCFGGLGRELALLGCTVFEGSGLRSVLGDVGWSTWTPKVCRIIAFYRFWAIILPTFEGLGRVMLYV